MVSTTNVSTFMGYLDIVNPWLIAGWAYNKDKFGPVDLLVYDNGHILCRTTADYYRADLDVDAYGNTGRLGFRLDVQLSPMGPHEISVVDADTGAHLTGSPKSIGPSFALDDHVMNFISALFENDAEDISFERRLAFVEDLKTKLLTRRERTERRRRKLARPFVTSSNSNSESHRDATRAYMPAAIELGKLVKLRTSTTPVASIIIPVFGRTCRLMSCLRSIARWEPSVQYEIIVVLNEPVANEHAKLTASTSGLVVIASDLNLGLAGACNRGKAAASGEYLVILHDDTEVESHWLDELVRCALDHPQAGAVMSKIIFPDGRLQHVGRLLSREGGTYAPWSDVLPSADSITSTSYIDTCSSSSLLIRRAAWDAIGGLEECFYPAYYVDVDVCVALQALRYSILCEPRSVVRHFQSASSSNEQKDFCLWRNRSLFLEKWSSSLHERVEYTPQDHAAFVQRAQDRCESLYAANEPSGDITEKPFDPEAQRLRLQTIKLGFMQDFNLFLSDLG